MRIEQEENNGGGAFYIEKDGERLAEMTYYLPNDGSMVIDHTEVDDELRGNNIGGQLVNIGVEYARTNGLKIVPECPFVKSVFESSHEYDDVWK